MVTFLICFSVWTQMEWCCVSFAQWPMLSKPNSQNEMWNEYPCTYCLLCLVFSATREVGTRAQHRLRVLRLPGRTETHRNKSRICTRSQTTDGAYKILTSINPAHSDSVFMARQALWNKFKQFGILQRRKFTTLSLANRRSFTRWQRRRRITTVCIAHAALNYYYYGSFLIPY